MSVQGKRGRLSRGQDPLQQLLASTDTSIVLETDLPNPNPMSAPFVFLSTLTPENLNSSAEPTEFLLSEASSEVSVALESNGCISQGVMWQGEGYLNSQQDTQILLNSNRYENDRLGFDCDTQTYHTSTTMENFLDMETGIDEGNMRVCCVHGCESRTNDSSAQTKFYTIPVDELQLRLWADSLEIDLNENVLINGLAICEKHLVSPTLLFPEKRKKTMDYESEKYERGLALSRSKRKPKPNKAYDWAQVIPFIKSEPLEENNDTEVPLSSLRGEPSTITAVGHKRKQVLSFIKDESDEKENQQPLDTQAIHEVIEAVEYLENISEASAPRDPPPRPKGRSRKIRDSPVQTEGRGCDKSNSSRQLREVKIQCDLTIEGQDGTNKTKTQHTSCAGCSNIDWKKLEVVVSACVAEIEGAPCDPMVTNCLKKFLLDVMQPSHAANVIKMLANMHKDALDNGKNIILVSSQPDEEEVEIENITFWEAPIDGVREITPSESWRKPIGKTKQELQPPPPPPPLPPPPPHDPLAASIFDIMTGEDDPDELGLEAAAEMDDDEFNPADVAEDEDDDDDEPEPDPEELEDDEDWDIRMGDDPPPKKRRKGIGGRLLKDNVGEMDGSGRPKEQGIKKIMNEQHEKEMKRNKYTRVIELSDDDKTISEIEEYKVRERKVIPPRRKKPFKRGAKKKISLARPDGDVRWIRGSFACPTCNNWFSTKLKMEQHHQHIHLGIAPWTGSHLCEDCGKTFTQKIGLRVHRMHKHGEAKLFHCELCNYEGPTKGKLERHMISHSDDKKYKCDYCDASLKTLDTYKNHIASHTNDGKYVCDICPKAFMHKQYYEDHRRSHFDVREFVCDVCSTAFKTQKSLRTHIRGVHLNDKRIICDICGARFMTNYNLRGHMKKHIHAEDLPAKYTCDLCPQKFRGEAGLFVHLQDQHSEKIQHVQIKIDSESIKEGETLQGLYSKIRSEPLIEETDLTENVYTADVEHVIMESGEVSRRARYIKSENSETIAEDLSVMVEAVEAVEAIQAVVEDRGENVLPSSEISTIYMYPCYKCGTMFNSQDDLSQHVDGCHGNSKVMRVHATAV